MKKFSESFIFAALILCIPITVFILSAYLTHEWNKYDAKCTIYETRFGESTSPTLIIEDSDCEVEKKLNFWLINISDEFKQIIVKPKEE